MRARGGHCRQPNGEPGAVGGWARGVLAAWEGRKGAAEREARADWRVAQRAMGGGMEVARGLVETEAWAAAATEAEGGEGMVVEGMAEGASAGVAKVAVGVEPATAAAATVAAATAAVARVRPAPES